MKAAIVKELAKPPVYGDFKDPVPEKGQAHISVTAAAISPLTKSRASGTHYTKTAPVPFVPGTDGVGRLQSGQRVYFLFPVEPFGGMAQATIVPESCLVSIPDDLDDVTAAALANPGMSSWAAFTEVAKLTPGQTVLVNGATGSAGRLAVQIARHLGAKKVIATGRDPEALKSLGADATISLVHDPREMQAAFLPHLQEGVDVVADYLWGPSAESILAARADTGNDSPPLRFVQIGAISGGKIYLSASVLRSSPIEIMGSGIGKVSLERLVAGIGEMLKAAVQAGFHIAATPAPLHDVEWAWSSDSSDTRTVIVMEDTGY